MLRPKPPIVPVAAEVRQDQESEAALIEAAKQALSVCNWMIGQCASEWTDRWAKGRTDEDFGNAIGMSREQVSQRRLVWERFRDWNLSSKLSWTHFRQALSWDDADACLQWASDNDATVAEMKAWRDVQHGGNCGLGTIDDSESLSTGEFVASGDPFGSDDPFGEGDSGTGTEPEGEEDGTETGWTDPAEEESTRPPRIGTEAPGGKTQRDLFAEQKAKAVKTLEAGMRAIDDLHSLKPIPQHDALDKAIQKMIATVKAVK